MVNFCLAVVKLQFLEFRPAFHAWIAMPAVPELLFPPVAVNLDLWSWPLNMTLTSWQHQR